jgi:hypothetical protein
MEVEKLKRREYNRQYQIRYRKEHAEHLKKVRKSYNKKYSLKHADSIRIRNKNYAKRRRQSDIIYRIKCVLTARLRQALKSQSIKKSLKTFGLLGASTEDTLRHLESQFKSGMTRENHGLKGWVVDHIRPCSSFDLSDPEQQKICFHYTNLQPLWWWENLSKSNKITS